MYHNSEITVPVAARRACILRTITQLYLSKALRSSEVLLYFVVKLSKETSLSNETLHTCLTQCVEDTNDSISVI